MTPSRHPYQISRGGIRPLATHTYTPPYPHTYITHPYTYIHRKDMNQRYFDEQHYCSTQLLVYLMSVKLMSHVTCLVSLPFVTCLVSLPFVTCLVSLPFVTCLISLPFVTCLVSLPFVTCFVSLPHEGLFAVGLERKKGIVYPNY